MTSTTALGDAFRDLVCDLLRTQFPDAKPEQRLGGTKVDILFSRVDFGRTIKFAVECKHYGQPLTKTFIQTDIWSAYKPLQEAGLVQRVLIVSRKPLGADAAAFMETWANASHLTYEELAESMMGLRPYLDWLAQQQPTDATQYIDARLEDQLGRAEDLIAAWVEAPGQPGLAILGGYGQGKTSLARHLAAVYARRHLGAPTARMPILVHLGEVVHETQLEGLFGKQFTARFPAPGYQFRTLEHLNKAGRLLIVLDGFDEMKHAMTAADFQANFREFNRLLEGQAKVLLLGRPNALPSDERDLVFRGKAKVGDQVVASASFTPWIEWKLALFNAAEARSLLTSALTVLQTRHVASGRFQYTVDFVPKRVEEVFALVPLDLLYRPVHVQLVAELGADPAFDFRGFNLFKLYDHFIRQMVERDTVQKPARRAIPLEARLSFQRELAWWAWRRQGSAQGCFYRHEVPASILKDLPDGNAVDDEGKRNEYVVSTLTEEKETGVLFFAHRSFQEFLVAERMRLGKSTPAAHTDYSNFLTPDIIAFLRQAPSFDYLIGWYETLRGASGPLSTIYLEFLASHPNLLNHIRETTLVGDASEIDAWSVCILHLGGRLGTLGAITNTDLQRVLVEVVRYGRSPAAAMAALAILEDYNRYLDPSTLTRIVAAVLERCLRASRSDGGSLVVPQSEADFATTWLAAGVRRQFPKPGEIKPATLEFDLNVFEQHCASQLHPKGAAGQPLSPFGDSVRKGAAAPVMVEVQKVYDQIDAELRKRHHMFLTSKRASFTTVAINERRPSGTGRRS